MAAIESKARSATTTPARLTRLDFAIASAIFVVTLALRLLFLFRSQDTVWPHSVLYEGDAPVWARWAAMLAAGQPFEDDLPFRTPGVAFVLRWLGMTTPPFTAAKVLWCVMSAATPAVLQCLVTRWFGRVAACVATLLTAISFGSFALATSLNNEVPYALLVTITLALTLRWTEAPNTGRSIALGTLHGACMLLRAEHVALLVALDAWAAASAWRRGSSVAKALAQASLVAAFAVLACVPWMLRSHAAVERFNTNAATIVFERARPPWTPGAVAMFRALPGFAQGPNFAFLADIARREAWPQVDERAVHDFFENRWGSTPQALPAWSLVSFKGPLDFALSNDLRGDGGFSRAALADAESADPAFSLARPSHAHLVNHGYEVGWASMRSDPERWVRLVDEKLLRFANGATLGVFADDWPHGPRHLRQAIDLAVPAHDDAPTWSRSMLGLMLVGALVAAASPSGGALLAVLGYRVLVIVAFYGYARHAASIGPVLFPLVGLAVQWMAAWATSWKALRERARFVRTVAIVVVVVAMALAFRSAWNPPVWFATPARAGGQITPTPQWHADAFEAVDPIVIEPMPASAR